MLDDVDKQPQCPFFFVIAGPALAQFTMIIAPIFWILCNSTFFKY